MPVLTISTGYRSRTVMGASGPAGPTRQPVPLILRSRAVTALQPSASPPKLITRPCNPPTLRAVPIRPVSHSMAEPKASPPKLITRPCNPPTLRAVPIRPVSHSMAEPKAILAGPGLSWLLFGGAPFGSVAFAVRGPDLLAVPRLVSLRLTLAPAATVVVLRPTAAPVVSVDTPAGLRIVRVWAAGPMAAPVTVLRQVADVASTDTPTRPLVGQARGPAAASVPLVVRLTADPSATQPDSMPVLVAPRIVQPPTATPLPLSLATRDVTALQASDSPPVVLVARAYYGAPTIAPTATHSTADPVSADTPTRSLVVQVLAPLAAAARAFVATLLADQPAAPTTAAPVPVVARVTTPTALPVPVLLRPTADPVASTDTLPRTTIVPVATVPAAAPRAAVWAPLAEPVAQDTPRPPVAVAVTSRQWAPVPVVVRPVTDPAAPDAPPRLILVTAPSQITAAARPSWTSPSAVGALDNLPVTLVVRPLILPTSAPGAVLARTAFALDPAVRLQVLIARAGSIAYPVTVALVRSTYGDPPAARVGKATAGTHAGPTAMGSRHSAPGATGGQTLPTSAGAGQHAGPGATAGTHTSPTATGGQA
jgi:hypothetical protein